MALDFTLRFGEEYIIVIVAKNLIYRECHCERSEAILVPSGARDLSRLPLASPLERPFRSDCHACVPERLPTSGRHFGVQARPPHQVRGPRKDNFLSTFTIERRRV
jgi:hypothetical protein